MVINVRIDATRLEFKFAHLNIPVTSFILFLLAIIGFLKMKVVYLIRVII